MPTFSSAAGSALHYELRGRGPLLVCHPGGPARPASYLDTLGRLDRTRTLLLLDSRGVGASEAADSYGFGSLAADLEELRLHLGVESLDVLGHSAGAWPVLAYAAGRPDRIRRLVLLTPSRRLIPEQDGEPDQADLAERWFGEQPWFGAAMTALAALNLELPEPEIQALLLASAPLLYGVWDAEARAHATRPYDATSAPVARNGFWSSEFDPAGLAAVTAPVRVIVGERDIITGLHAPAVLAGWFPNSSLTALPGCGHYPWIKDPAAVSATIEAALSDPD